MSRFVFHFADPLRFLREAVRVLKPGGVPLFDAYRWTPRAWVPGEQRYLGGRTHGHSSAIVNAWAHTLGLVVERAAPLLLVAPYLYGFLPESLTRWLEKQSDGRAPGAKTKSYYLLRRPAGVPGSRDP